jgi:cytochrome c oxidase subunit 2
MRILSFIITTFITFASSANGISDWQLGFQTPASDVMRNVYDLHNFVLIMMTAITIFVLFLIFYVVFRFRKKANPVASKTTHNTFIEILWTGIPVIILIFMAIPSFKLVYQQDVIPETDMTIKVIGHQWYWEYQYPEHDDLSFESYMIPDDELEEGDLRLLTVDNHLVLPANKNIHVLVTGGDVLHSFAMPSLGVKKDAVPGRLNETWFKAEKTGTYYGQCSELCGPKHAFMPINVKVVSQDEFDNWLSFAKEEYASSKTNFNQTFQVAKN